MDQSNKMIKEEPASPSLKSCDDIDDDRLRDAVSKVNQGNGMLPIVKEELRCSILSRRHANGQGDIVFEEPKRQPKGALTEEEKRRKSRRREQNRRAATKCRIKKKYEEEILAEAYGKEKDKNKELATELISLRKELEQLQKLFNSHIPTCHLMKESQGSTVLSQYEDITPTTSVLPTPETPSSVYQPEHGSIIHMEQDTTEMPHPPVQIDVSHYDHLSTPQCMSDVPADLRGGRVTPPLNQAYIYTSSINCNSFDTSPQSFQNRDTDSVDQCHPNISASPFPQNDQSFTGLNGTTGFGLNGTSPSFYSGTGDHFTFSAKENFENVPVCQMNDDIPDLRHDAELFEEDNASVGSKQSWEDISYCNFTALLQNCDGAIPALTSDDLTNLPSL